MSKGDYQFVDVLLLEHLSFNNYYVLHICLSLSQLYRITCDAIAIIGFSWPFSVCLSLY